MERTATNRLLVILPCYNEQDSVVPLFEELRSLRLDGWKLDPLFINDASTDATEAELTQNGIQHLTSSVNLGIGATVQLGLLYAARHGYDYAVQMDGDGQHPPSELHKLLNAFRKNEIDVAIGSRFVEQEGFQSTVWRRTGIMWFTWLNQRLCGARILDSTSGFRAYSKRAIKVLTEYYPDEYPEPEAIVFLARRGMRIGEVPVVMRERLSGKSSIRRFGTLYYMAKVTLNTLFLRLRLLH